ncbi:DUF421 domain-containing protein [Halalkalibacterium halodurans]|uniref:DUF421 domain-containing protein n=1 Tax=Halalkalibacterium halodurans TaxID=86665 RepID=UPI002E218A47|nr:DUF421 domain-containing protein [Halalkalibacterium halodurans]
MDFAWQAIIMMLSGFLLLRISGRKSIAQMSIPTTVVMISIGAIIVQPIIEHSMIKTIVTIAIFVALLIVLEFLQMKIDVLEKLSGQAISVIENGQFNLKNIRKIRMTIDKIEMQMRQNGISNLADIKNATIEPNGQMGYELKPDARPLTVGEFKKLMGAMVIKQNQSADIDGSLFYEVIHESTQFHHQMN